MKVKRIEECSKGNILQCVRPSLSYHLSLRSLFCLILSGRLRQGSLYSIMRYFTKVCTVCLDKSDLQRKNNIPLEIITCVSSKYILDTYITVSNLMENSMCPNSMIMSNYIIYFIQHIRDNNYRTCISDDCRIHVYCSFLCGFRFILSTR